MRINCTVESRTPLLINKVTDEAILRMKSGSRSAQSSHQQTPKEEATKKLHLSKTGKPIIPSPNLFKSIIEGGRFFKLGKSKITTLKSSLIPACVEIEEVEIPIRSKDGWEVDSRPVRVPTTGGVIMAHRPMFDKWSLGFTINLDEEMMSSQLLYEIIEAAGTRIGLGDFRPDRKGPFGKYRITQWKEGK